MLIVSDLKLISAIIAVALVIVGDCLYCRDIFKKKITPHLYSWLIWTITQGTATAGSWSGGGEFAAISLACGTILQIAILGLTFKYVTKRIKMSDTVLLAGALLAIIVWWQMRNPLIAVLMVTGIDAVGFIPTFRKAFEDPWSEALSFWVIMTIAAIFMIASSALYNSLTVFYMATIFIGNLTVWMICFFRRGVLKETRFTAQ